MKTKILFVSAIAKELVTFAFQEHQKLRVWTGLEVIRGREIPDQLCLPRVGCGMNTGSNITLARFLFPTFCLDFLNHFLLKVCATLFLS